MRVKLINRETQSPVGERFASRLVVQCLGFVYKMYGKFYDDKRESPHPLGAG